MYYCIIIIFSYNCIKHVKYNLCEDISHDVLFYLMNCGSVIKNASDNVCYGSLFRLYPGKIEIYFEKQHFTCSVL